MSFPSTIKVAVVETSGIFTFKKNGASTVVSGSDGLLLNCLAEKLNFNYEVLVPTDGEWGALRNGTWTGIISMLANGSADIGMALMTVVEDRFRVIDYSTPYAVFERTFAAKEPGLMPKFMAFTYPFNINVWILLLLLIFTAAILFQKVMLKNESILGSFILVLGSVVWQAIEKFTTTSWKRILFGFWLTIATVMPFLYSTCFLSFLTMPGKLQGLENLEDLSNAVARGKYKCLTPKGTVDRVLLLASNIEYLRKLGEEIEKHNWEYCYKQNLDDIMNDSTALIISRQMMHMRFGNPSYINKAASKDTFGVWNIAVAISKKFCCKRRLNEVVQGILSGGLYKKWFDDTVFLENLKQHLNLKYTKPGIALTTEDLKAAFIILSIGLALSFLVFLVELFTAAKFHANYFRC
ncbi:lig_chan-Glu_bd domain-containing protein [Nephila pilipes]|uniref:Lig_chan-Glu_bd domain-containing protein n=1 Tax=Nephila pilipes TaxID=299642 RepID=A0A8X6QDP3_NEPPI|nr:lig_chan-Glu_bd domain-containing protein [Nephila pilipes]